MKDRPALSTRVLVAAAHLAYATGLRYVYVGNVADRLVELSHTRFRVPSGSRAAGELRDEKDDASQRPMPPLRHRDTRPVGVSFARPARSQPPEKAQHVRLVARAERGQLEGDAPDGAAGPARGEAGKEQERALRRRPAPRRRRAFPSAQQQGLCRVGVVCAAANRRGHPARGTWRRWALPQGSVAAPLRIPARSLRFSGTQGG